jgi:peptidoglycan/xylan/chitin deacetylase (PgdA/CDA1 family)
MLSKTTVLMYHRVLEDADCVDYPFPSLIMPRSLFERQVDWLAERAHVVPVSDALSAAHAFSPGRRPQVCLTFDDGYVDNFELAAPALEARGLRGTFFITAGAVERRESLWYDRAAAMWSLLGRHEIRQRLAQDGNTDVAELETRGAWIQWLKLVSNDRRETIMSMLDGENDDGAPPCPLMTPDQVRQLSEAGHEIGSHTLSHPILTTMTEEKRQIEIERARQLLREWTQQEVAGFCYPNGDFDAAVVRQLREAGHTYACTTQPGRNHEGTDRFQLRRIDVTRDRVAASDGSFDLLGFRAEISLLREGIRRWTEANDVI